MLSQIKKHKGLFLTILLLSTWGVLLYFYTPDEIVSAIGVEGGYALVFVTALIGVSSFTSTSFYAVLITFASTGEFNPLLLGAVAAPGRVIGDSLFYFLGYHGRAFLDGKYFSYFSEWVHSHPKWAAPFVAYAYTAFTPLPQDFLMIVLGIGGVSFRKIFLAALLGNATFVALVSYLVIRGML